MPIKPKFKNPGKRGFVQGTGRVRIPKEPTLKIKEEPKSFLGGLSRPAIFGSGVAAGGFGFGGGMYIGTRKRTTEELSAKLDEIIEFQAFGAIQNILGKLGKYGETAGGAVEKSYAALAQTAQQGAQLARQGYAAAAPALQKGASAVAKAARTGYAAAAPVVQSGVSALGRGITAADAAIGRGRQIAGNVAGSVAGNVAGATATGIGAAATGAAGAAKSGYGALKNVVGKIGAAREAGKAKSALQGGTRSYFDRSYGPGGINAPIGGTPPPVPANLAASSSAGVAPGAAAAPAAAAPGTQAQAAQATANAAGQQAGQQAAAQQAAAAKGVTGKKPAGKKSAAKKGAKPAAEEEKPGWWSGLSTRKKWMYGAGAGVAAGGLGAAYLSDSNQQMSAKIKDVKIFESAEEPIWFDNRPRNQEGQFTPEEGGPDPNAMATVYKQPGIISSLAKGSTLALGGGALGEIGGKVGKGLLAQAKKRAKSIR
jgi:hypothetical protein